MEEYLKKEQLEKEWKAVEAEIIEAFKDVKLGDGIGYYEADAIDDYLQPNDPLYIKLKAKDERNDWRKIDYAFGENEEVSFDRHCFMDAKGLHFYIPFLLTERLDLVSSILGNVLHALYKKENDIVDNKRPYLERYLELYNLLTDAQKKSVWHFYELEQKAVYEDFWLSCERWDLDFNEDVDSFALLKKHFGGFIN